MLLKKILSVLILLTAVNICFAQEQKIKVYAFVAEECPVSIFMAASLKRVAENYAGNAQFFLVFPMSTSDYTTAELFKKENGLTDFTIKVDKHQTLTKKLGASVTPEVIITGAGETVLYKGRINDAFTQPGKKKHSYSQDDLGNALAYVTNGQEMPKPWKPAVGCFITIEKE